MAMNINESGNYLRPNYDFALPSLEQDSGSRGLVYKAIHPGIHVLDVGCDTGRFGDELRKQKGCIVDGVEPYLPAAETARARLNQVFVRSIENEKSFDGLVDYDAILFMDVLEHLQNPWSVLKGAFKSLKPGGTIYVVVPNIAHISVVRRLLQGKFEYRDYGTMDRTHLRWFTRSSLRQSFEEAGFVNIDIKPLPRIPYLQENSLIEKFFIDYLVKIFPDQIGASLIGKGQRPITG
jgi:2-polyprenyl-3-methyl-5-hydroxy-6-metoxy-1,4-benzoquinol methylase